eukprot:TRINITY_DN67060_c0_g1_i1.p1 TRINITY_DN67060_c0_g1~~TRINITY_DN67060_c0_g1_i1.p1  ORF type:complete len:459 (-),score=78.32 TRINITY_DN67060_c0_g1_i1:211-1587(-)
MDDEYDVVVCGTGLKECILSALLSKHGKRVLHLDRNNYYGGETASVTLTSLWEMFRPGEKPPAELGADRDWSVDIIPKFVMATGGLVNILLKTKASRYLEWQSIDGTYVYQYQEAGYIYGSEQFIHKVPASSTEAMNSPLMGILEKNRCRSFFTYVAQWTLDDPSTHESLDPKTTTMRQVYEHFGLQEDTVDFVGHAVALHTSDDYLDEPCELTLKKIRLYMHSMAQYGISPFIYPVYGLGGIPEGCTRLAAVHSGLFMLNSPVEGFEFGEDGRVKGVRADGKVAKCSMVVCDPSYAPSEKKRSVGKVIRCICILGAPIPNTNDAPSCQVIIPQRQLDRRSDVYISMVSWSHKVARKDKYIAIVSATVETEDPEAEIAPALKLLGSIEEKFVRVSDVYQPTSDGERDGVFVTSCHDATSHFETASAEVLDLWRKITGSELDLTLSPEDMNDEFEGICG